MVFGRLIGKGTPPSGGWNVVIPFVPVAVGLSLAIVLPLAVGGRAVPAAGPQSVAACVSQAVGGKVVFYVDYGWRGRQPELRSTKGRQYLQPNRKPTPETVRALATRLIHCFTLNSKRQ